MPVHNEFLRSAAGTRSAELQRLGAFLPVEVHVPLLLAEALQQRGEPVPSPVAGVALIDTGASLSCVDESGLRALGLSPLDVVNVATPTGTVRQNVYPSRLVFPTKGWVIDLAAVVGVSLTGHTIPVTPPQPMVVLIGRNILEDWVLTYNGPGGFWTVSF